MGPAARPLWRLIGRLVGTDSEEVLNLCRRPEFNSSGVRIKIHRGDQVSLRCLTPPPVQKGLCCGYAGRWWASSVRYDLGQRRNCLRRMSACSVPYITQGTGKPGRVAGVPGKPGCIAAGHVEPWGQGGVECTPARPI